MDAYDYIVVGAGSAGCVVARRLTDDPSVRVLLLEAGPQPNNFWIGAPAGSAKLFKSERFNWNFFSEPAPTLGGRRIYLPRGKVLGGSSAINGMVHLRGHRLDYEHWASLGNVGWGWDDVLPYFRRSETNERGASPAFGTDGPLTVSDPVLVHPTVFDFIKAAENSGLPRLDHLDGSLLDGVGLAQFNIRNGVRHTSYDAFVRPVLGRPNLTVRSNVHVRRILIEERDAVGVELVDEGVIRSVAARREVVLSAGAYGSPHLLMLSGIGDGDALQRHGVAPAAHVPGVGRNLQDHFSNRLQVRSKPGSSYNRSLRGWRKYAEGARYLFRKRGYLALGSSPAAAFVKSSPSVPYPDLEIGFRAMSFTFKPSGEAEIDGYDGIGASVYRTRPDSRGEVLLRSRDPMDAPAIVTNGLGDPRDVEAALFGVKLVRTLFTTEPLASHVLGEIVPGPEVRSDEQIVDYIRSQGGFAFHPAGTCKMGNDAMAVVDDRLRVRGVERLRVVDASIMPVVASGNTNAATVMIGEKGAEMIRLDAIPARPARALHA